MARTGKQDDIQKFLRNILSAGSRKAQGIIDAGERVGYSARSINTAKAELGIDSFKRGVVWYWQDASVPEPVFIAEPKPAVISEPTPKDYIPVVVRAPEPTPTIDPARAEEIERLRLKALAAREGAAMIREIVKSDDPFAVLESASLRDTERMLLTVQNHVFELVSQNTEVLYEKYTGDSDILEARTRQVEVVSKATGKVKMRFELAKNPDGTQVYDSEHKPQTVQVPITETEHYTVPGKEQREGQRPIGQRQIRDISVETAKREDWISRAKMKINALENPTAPPCSIKF